MNFEDRISTYPNRYSMTTQNGGTSFVILERADDPIQVGTPLNADTFEALIAEMRAYVEANNLLDNSNFRNPVNQRGVNRYSDASQYTIDRWRATNRIEVVVEDGYIRVSCNSTSTRNSLTQHLPPEKTPTPGTAVTVAYEDATGNVYVASGAMPESGYLDLFGATGIDVRLYGSDDSARLSFLVPVGGQATLRWIALYEGEYTKDTLPKYRPKDFSAELMECMRYYQVSSTNNVPAADMRPTMRTVPTITQVEGGYAYSADL